MSFIQIFLLFVLSVIKDDPLDHKVGHCFLIYCMSKPKVVRRATWRELRVLVTTANVPQLLEHVNQPTVCWARNCSGLDRGGRPAAAHRSCWQGCATSRCLGTRHWGRELFRSNSTAALVCAGVEAGARWRPVWTHFCWNLRCFLVGSWPLAGVLFAWVFSRDHELAMDFHKHQQSQYVRLAYDSATALSKEASDENLWKLNPTPSRHKLRVFARTGSHTSCVRRST